MTLRKANFCLYTTNQEAKEIRKSYDKIKYKGTDYRRKKDGSMYRMNDYIVEIILNHIRKEGVE